MAADEKVYVPYGDFVDGVQAQADLDSIRAILTHGAGFCSDDIKAILGLEVDNSAATANVGK